MSLDIVIARYKEDISWIDSIIDKNFDINIHVYNKHKGENLLPNVGREGHTYVYHIIDKYHDLRDTIFLQGNPFDFDHEFPKGTIKKFIVDYFNEDKKELDFFSFNSNAYYVDKNGYPTRRSVPIPVGAFYEKIFGEKSSPEVFEFNAGACFFVSKKAMQNICLEKYQVMLDSLSHCKSPVEGHCLERMWRTIFLKRSEKKIKEICLGKGFPKNYPANCIEDDEIKTLHQNLLGKNYLYGG